MWYLAETGPYFSFQTCQQRQRPWDVIQLFFFFFNPKLDLFREDVELFLPECSILLIVGINLLSGTPPLHEEAPLQVVWNYTDVFSQFLLGEKFNSQILSAFSLIWPLAFTRLLIFMKYAVYFYFKTTTTL